MLFRCFCSLLQIPNRLPFAPALYLVERLTSCFRSAFRLTRSDLCVCLNLSAISSALLDPFCVSFQFRSPSPPLGLTRCSPSPIPLFLVRGYSAHLAAKQSIQNRFSKSIDELLHKLLQWGFLGPPLLLVGVPKKMDAALGGGSERPVAYGALL